MLRIKKTCSFYNQNKLLISMSRKHFLIFFFLENIWSVNEYIFPNLMWNENAEINLYRSYIHLSMIMQLTILRALYTIIQDCQYV